MDINLDRTSSVPLGDQLQAQLRVQIVAGTLAPGDLLPTVQTLAADTDTNYNTVAAAYRALEAQGYLVQRRRAGTRVAPQPPVGAQEVLAVHLSADIAERIRNLDVAEDDMLHLIGAQMAREKVSGRAPHVAVLSSDATSAASLAHKVRALLGEKMTYIPVTLASYQSQRYALTLVAPALLESLLATRDTVQNPVPFTPLWTNTPAFPAGAD